jgi:exosortase D (VPLPA-CTERM-specific)
MLRAILLLVLSLLYAPVAWQVLVDCWNDDNYSYGIVVPILVAWLIWRRRHEVVEMTARSMRLWQTLAWSCLGAGLTLFVVGNAAAEQYSIRVSGVFVLLGVVGVWGGAQRLRRFALPLILLLTMIPLPYTIYYRLSFPLQLLSARIAAASLDFLGLQVQRWGNVFEVNGQPMEVVRACSGVRSMMTLGTLAASVAVILRLRAWAGVLLLLLSAPVAMLGNAVRLLTTALLVLLAGPRMAEGWRHDAVGLVGFAVSLLILAGMTRLLVRWGRPDRTDVRIPPVAAGTAQQPFDPTRFWSALQPAQRRPAVVVCVLLVTAGLYGAFLGSHTPAPQRHSNLQSFPMTLMQMQGEEVVLSDRILEQVGVDDYLFRNYSAPGAPRVNLYVGYYRSQRQGSQIHSPQHCYPGSGWNVEKSEPLHVRNRKGHVEELRRLVVRKQDRTDVVVYWYDTRTGRLSSDFQLKFNLMRTALLHLPQDAAFVRWSTAVEPQEDIEAATLRLLTVAARSLPQLDRSLPFDG